MDPLLDNDIKPEDATPPPPPTQNFKDFLTGPKTNALPAHGWTNASILFNHLDANAAKVMSNPASSLAAVIVRRDRPADRAMASDAIADAIVTAGLAAQNEFTVIPSTPKDGDPTSSVLPHTNLIVCDSTQLADKIRSNPEKAIVNARRKDETDGFTFYLMPVVPESSWYIATFVGLSDRLTRSEFKTALFDKLVHDYDVVKLLQEHHDRVPNAPDHRFVLHVLLEYAEFKPCQVWMPSRRGSFPQRQNAIRLYMPPPSFHDDAIKAWKSLLTAPAFTFVVDCRGRAAPFRPETSRSANARPMECVECLGLDHYKDDCPITTSPNFLAVHITQDERDAANIGTSLATIRESGDVDADGFRKVNRRPFKGRRNFPATFTGRGRRLGRY